MYDVLEDEYEYESEAESFGRRVSTIDVDNVATAISATRGLEP